VVGVNVLEESIQVFLSSLGVSLEKLLFGDFAIVVDISAVETLDKGINGLAAHVVEEELVSTGCQNVRRVLNVVFVNMGNVLGVGVASEGAGVFVALLESILVLHRVMALLSVVLLNNLDVLHEALLLSDGHLLVDDALNGFGHLMDNFFDDLLLDLFHNSHNSNGLVRVVDKFLVVTFFVVLDGDLHNSFDDLLDGDIDVDDLLIWYLDNLFNDSLNLVLALNVLDDFLGDFFDVLNALLNLDGDLDLLDGHLDVGLVDLAGELSLTNDQLLLSNNLLSR